MLILLYTAVGLLAFIAFAVTLGFCLPPQSEGRLVARYDAPVDVVWHAFQDVEAHPMTGKAKRSIERYPDEDAGPRWSEDMGHGEVIDVRTTVCEPPRRLVRAMSARATRMTSEWAYRFEPEGGGTVLELSGATTIQRGTWHTPIFRVMMRVGGGVRAGLRIQARAVAKTLEVELDERA